MVWLMLVYCLVYAPTLALTNSIAFINLKDSEKDFGSDPGLGNDRLDRRRLGPDRLAGRWPSPRRRIAMQGRHPVPGRHFLDPHGPAVLRPAPYAPQKGGAKPWAFLEALKMFKDRDFLIFTVISFVVATELQFYYVLTAPFLTSPKIGVARTRSPAVMTIAQIAEIFVMALLLS